MGTCASHGLSFCHLSHRLPASLPPSICRRFSAFSHTAVLHPSLYFSCLSVSDPRLVSIFFTHILQSCTPGSLPSCLPVSLPLRFVHTGNHEVTCFSGYLPTSYQYSLVKRCTPPGGGKVAKYHNNHVKPGKYMYRGRLPAVDGVETNIAARTHTWAVDDTAVSGMSTPCLYKCISATGFLTDACHT